MNVTTVQPDMPPHRTGKPALVAAVVGGLLLVLVIGVYSISHGSVAPSGPLPVVAQTPAFSFTERSGRTVTQDDLHGHIWVVDFFFTSCTGPCPEMTLRMRSLQQAVLDEALPVTLVSVSIDPEIDRPAVLRRYANKYGADPDRWLFLTGENQEAVHKLVKTGFLVAVKRATNETPIIHATYFLLIDAGGRIRGVYEGLKPESKAQILAAIRRLQQEQPSS